MISNPLLQWLLSAAFLGIAVYALVRTVRARTFADRVSYATHVLMGVAMFTMVWPWGMQLLLVPQIVVFGLSTVWFLWLFFSRRHHTAEMDSHHSGSGILAYHAGMMAAMVVMAVGMMQMGATASSVAAGGHHDMASMPGMDMSGAGGGGGMGFPLWVGVASALAALGFGIAALYFIGNTLASATSSERASRRGRTRTAEAVWNLLMAVGMAVLFIPMASFG